MRPKTYSLIIAIAVILILSRVSFAEGIHDGSSLLKNCSYAEKAVEAGSESWQSVGCMAYIRGVLDGYQAGAPKENRLCIPEDVTNGQMSLVVLRYLRSNPDKLHEQSGWLTLTAIGEAFPCKK